MKKIFTTIFVLCAAFSMQAALHINYPNTTVYNDSGAVMEIEYIADTKLYIDKKFAELAAAIVNNNE